MGYSGVLMTRAQNKTPKVHVNPKLYAALQKIKQRDGIPAAEQVRRALAQWLESRAAPR